MKTFKARLIEPTQTPFVEVKADDLISAACEGVFAHRRDALFVLASDSGIPTAETTYYAVVEVEGAEPVVARYFYGGIGRKGGLKPRPTPLQCTTIAEVEARLKLSPGALDCDWEGEETMTEALARSFG